MQTNNTAYKQKGSTLVEVLVALAVFLIVMGTLVAGYLSAKKLVAKQREYVYFEAVCLDIDKYGDLYSSDWDRRYFGTFLIKDTADPAEPAGHGVENPGGTEQPGEPTPVDPTTPAEPANPAATKLLGGRAYFDAKFNLCTAENGKYCLTYFYNENNELVLSIENTTSNYFVIQNLIYDNNDGRYTEIVAPTQSDSGGESGGNQGGETAGETNLGKTEAIL